MGLVRTKNKHSKPTKIPSTAYPVDEIVATIAAIDIEGKRANDACQQLMERNPDVLKKHDVSIEKYNGKPGQIAGGLRLTLDRLVETNANAYDLALAAGLQVTNPRPTATRPQPATQPAPDEELHEAPVDPDEL